MAKMKQYVTFAKKDFISARINKSAKNAIKMFEYQMDTALFVQII
jgi:hypothetical protein